jgi:hypothetical protein
MPGGLLASGVQTSRRRLRSLAGTGWRPRATCPACGQPIRHADHAVVLHGRRHHVGCALYSRAR